MDDSPAIAEKEKTKKREKKKRNLIALFSLFYSFS